MKAYLILFSLLYALAGVAHAGDEDKAEVEGATTQSVKLQYLVGLAEYEFEKPVPMGLSESEIIDAIERSKMMPIATLRMTVVAGTESMVEISRRVSIVESTVVRGTTAVAKNFDNLKIGAVLRIRISTHADGALADVDYTTSRIDGDAKGDPPPDIVSSSANATQIYALGQPRLLSLAGGKKTTCVLITVREIP